MPDSLVSRAERKRNYHALDALRGVAAIEVVMFHYQTLLGRVRMTGAYLAVDLFFLMSGFVIAHAYERRFDAGLSVAQFAAIRICRLYPMFALGTLVTVAGIVAGLIANVPLVWTWPSLAVAGGTSILFLPSPPLPGKTLDLYPLNMPAWSLMFEMGVNVLFAATYPWLRGTRLAAVILLGAVGVGGAAWASGQLSGGVSYPFVWVGAVRVVFSFFLGVAMSRAHAKGALLAPRVPVPLLVVVVAALLSFNPPIDLRALYDGLCVLVLFPLLVWIALHSEPRRGIAICTVLGLVSYPLYMLHYPAQSAVVKLVMLGLGASPMLYAPWIGFVVIAALLLLSWLLARYIDPPLRRAVESLLIGRRTRRAMRPAA